LIFYWSAALLCFAIVLGGGTQVGLASDLVIQLLSAPLLVMTLFRLFESDAPRRWAPPLLILAGAFLLPLLQLIPLPPALWTALPGRELALSTYTTIGVPPPWMPVSLAPHATLYALFSMLPAAALFLAVLGMNTRERYALLIGPLVLGGASVLLGLAQLYGGHPQSVTLYSRANIGYAVGFFANRNHFAALLYSLLPLAAAWTLGSADRPENRRPIGLLLGGLAIATLVVGLSVAFSRAGVTLGVVAAFGCVLLIWQSRATTPLGKWPILAAVTVLLLVAVVLQFGLVDLLLRRTLADQQRSVMAATTLRAVAGFFGFGSGFGTFVPVYMIFEKPGDVRWGFVNHAHNDWLELTLEGGILAALLLAAFVVWFLHRAFVLWLQSDDATARDITLARAASLSASLLLLHSLLDYPLRTTTLMSLFAVCCGLVCVGVGKPAHGSRPRRTSRRRRHDDDAAI
jgi:hypothetical protein